MSKISTKWIADDAVTRTKINSDVAGDGITQAAGGELDVQVDTTGGANLAEVINVSANGVAVKVDGVTINGNGSDQLYVPNDSIDATQIDETDSFTWSGSHDFQTGTVHVATPTADSHATNKAYVDAGIEGLKGKGNAKAMSDSDETLTGLPTNIDGVVAWSDADIVLLQNQTDGIENGLWIVHATAWERPDNFDTGQSAEGSYVFVQQGTTYGDTGWWCTTNAPADVIGTNALTFEIFSRQGDISAGTGLTKNGNTLNVGDGVVEVRGGINFSADDIAVEPDGVTLEVDGTSDEVQVMDGGIDTLQLADAGVTNDKINTDVAGDGISGGAGSALALDINGIATAETTPNDADLIAIYDDSATALRKMTRGNFLAGVSTATTPIVEAHLVTAGEDTNGYFTLSQTPAAATRVMAVPQSGPTQFNKQIVGATGATPDFDILSTNQFHFNNNGAATGLSEDLESGDVIIIQYDY